MAVLIGSTTTGGSSDFFADGDAFGSAWVASATGTLETVTVPTNGSSSFTSFKVGVYTNSGGNPGSLLATSNALTSNAGANHVVTFTGGPTLTSGTTYWLMVLPNGGNFTCDYNPSGNHTGKALGSGVSSFPDPWNTSGQSTASGTIAMLGEGTLTAASEGGGGRAARPGRHRGRFPARETVWF